MFNIMKREIEKGGYKLDAMIHKISVLYGTNQFDEESYNALMELATKGANPDSEVGNILDVVKKINEMISSLDERVYKLEHKDDEPENNDTEEVPEGDSTDSPVTTTYPEWEPWNGLPGSGYKQGKKVIHNGKIYESLFVGINVWEPGTIGTDALWKEVEE